MNETPHDRWRPSPPFFLRGAAVSVLVGAVIGALFELGGRQWRWAEIAWAALVGTDSERGDDWTVLVLERL